MFQYKYIYFCITYYKIERNYKKSSFISLQKHVIISIEIDIELKIFAFLINKYTCQQISSSAFSAVFITRYLR